MESIALRSNDKKIEIKSELGLDITFRPFSLVQEILGKGSQKVLDGLIEAGWRIALMDFAKWHTQIFKGKNPAEIPTIEQKYKERDIAPEILALACYGRDLLFLHSDWETIELSADEVKAERASYAFWKYNALYGYKSAEERKKEIKNSESSIQPDAKSVKKQITQPVEKKPLINQKQGQKFQNPNMNVSESINLQPTIELDENGLPTWFIDVLQTSAKAMYVGSEKEAVNWLFNISRSKGTGEVFGIQQIAEWLQEATRQ